MQTGEMDGPEGIVIKSADGAGAGGNALDLPAVVGDGAFVIEIRCSVIIQPRENRRLQERPDRALPGDQQTAGLSFEHQIIVRLRHTIVIEDDKS